MKLKQFLNDVKIDFSTIEILKPNGNVIDVGERKITTFETVLKMKRNVVDYNDINPYLDMNIVKIVCAVHGVMKIYVLEEEYE